MPPDQHCGHHRCAWLHSRPRGEPDTGRAPARRRATTPVGRGLTGGNPVQTAGRIGAKSARVSRGCQIVRSRPAGHRSRDSGPAGDHTRAVHARDPGPRSQCAAGERVASGGRSFDRGAGASRAGSTRGGGKSGRDPAVTRSAALRPAPCRDGPLGRVSAPRGWSTHPRGGAGPAVRWLPPRFRPRPETPRP